MKISPLSISFDEPVDRTKRRRRARLTGPRPEEKEEEEALNGVRIIVQDLHIGASPDVASSRKVC